MTNAEDSHRVWEGYFLLSIGLVWGECFQLQCVRECVKAALCSENQHTSAAGA